MAADVSALELLQDMIRDYRRKVEDLRAERRVLEVVAGKLGIDLGDLDGEDTTQTKGFVPKSDQFFGMTQTGAVAEYLKLKGSPASMEELLEALKSGGLEITGKDPRTSLYSQLVRATMRFVRLPNGEFALLEWYPNVSQKRRRRTKSKGDQNGSPPDNDSTIEDADEPQEGGEVE